jgi:ATP-dependent helicase/nuclease subunit B
MSQTGKLQDPRIFDALKAGVPVITRSGRLARTVRREFDRNQAEGGAAAWPGATVMPWNSWLNELWDCYRYSTAAAPVRLGPWQEWAVWNRIVRSAPEAAGLLQPGATVSAAQQAWALAVEWRIDLEQIDAEGGEDARAFGSWACEYRRFTREQGMLEGVRIADALRAGLDRLRTPERLVLAGFDEFTPQQRDFLDALEQRGCRCEIAGYRQRGAEGRAVKAAFPDAEQSLAAAARWARALLETRPHETIGVIVPDLAARRAQVERIFGAVLEPASQLACGTARAINISAGAGLIGYPPVRAAVAILRLRTHSAEWSEISALVLDPYLGGAEGERSGRAALDCGLRARGLARLTPREVASAARDVACPLLAAAFERLLDVWQHAPERQRPSAWARTFAGALQAAGWPGEHTLTSAEYQTVEAWEGVLSEFAGTDLTAGELDLSDAVSLLARIAGATLFQPQGSGDAIQIMGSLEASGLGFDHLWIAGLDDETWPPPAKPDPFLPVRLQREAGMPHSSAERELAFARLVTERLLASSPDVVVSYPAHDGDRELSPSPLIGSVERVDAAAIPQWLGLGYDEAIRRSRVVERTVDETGPPAPAGVAQGGGAKVFEYQSACPFRAFVELRLGAEELESPPPGLDASARGNLVHGALEYFWLQVKSQEALLTRTDIPEVVAQSAAWALARFEQRRGAPLPERFAELERRRIERLVTGWLELEKAREPFEVVQPEKTSDAELGGIRFRLKFDRIDRLRDGSDVIVDYKTSTRFTAAWEGERPEEPQLPLYSVVYTGPPLAAVTFAVVKAGEMKFQGKETRDGVLPKVKDVVNMAATIAGWREVMERLAADFRAGRAEADPKNVNKSCRYCALAGLCRICDDGTVFDEEVQ